MPDRSTPTEALPSITVRRTENSVPAFIAAGNQILTHGRCTSFRRTGSLSRLGQRAQLSLAGSDIAQAPLDLVEGEVGELNEVVSDHDRLQAELLIMACRAPKTTNTAG